jgi:lipid A 3-O-deacylase
MRFEFHARHRRDKIFLPLITRMKTRSIISGNSRNSWLFLFFLFSVKLFSQDSIPKKTDSYFRFIYDNDFFSATDRYYSQGVLPELILPVLRKGVLPKILIPISQNAKNYYGAGIEQDCYTPRSIRYDTLNTLERPYCGLAYFRRFLYSMDEVKKRKLSTEIQIGIIGPNAKLEETQKGIHKALVNIQPLGWENQVSQDLLLNYCGVFEQGVISRKYFQMVAFAEGRAGTIYDDAGAGLYLRAGIMQSYFKNLGVEKNSKKKFQFYLTARGRVREVFYNGALQGGPFTTSIHTIAAKNITREVYFASFSAVFAYKRLYLEYLKAYTTKEFVWGLDHGWGRCNITFCF